MHIVKIFLRFAALLILLVVIFLGGIILYGTLTDYKPAPGSSVTLEISGKGKAISNTDTTLHFLNWNIGYGGLGAESDFFYDGGKMVRAKRENWDKYFNGITQTLLQNDSIDFYLIQEIDQNSKRSYHINQYDSVLRLLQNGTASFGLNYNVKHVPLPFTNPLGKVYSGVATYSRFQPSLSERFQYPGKFAWPTRIFFLDRCFISSRFPLQNGKELIVINTHNSAYDETGEVKKAEMEFLKEYVINEYVNGNYVVVGGDFNQRPPRIDAQKFSEAPENTFIPPGIDRDFMPPGWFWVFDAFVPTNRHLDAPLQDDTYKTLIDYYLVSPNVEVTAIRTLDLQFLYSDHQPVLMSVRIK